MSLKGFKKCGVSVAIDGSEDNEIYIKNLKDYGVESDDNDPFVSSESEDNGETDCSSDIHCSGDDSQTIPKLSVPFDYITNPKHFSLFAGGFIEVRDTSDEYFTISM